MIPSIVKKERHFAAKMFLYEIFMGSVTRINLAQNAKFIF